MAEQEDVGTGSKDRATVALVSEKVDGLKELVGRGFTDVQRQLDSMAGLPTRVATLEERQAGLSSRMDAAERQTRERDRDEREDEKEDATFHRVHLPTLIVSACAFLAAVAASVAAFIH